MIFYLAGPIDLTSDKGKGWREEFKELCVQDNNILLFDPVSPYSMFGNIDTKIAEYIYTVNMRSIDYADCIIARMMRGQSSIGTPIELYYAIEHKKPIILITDMEESIYMKYIGSCSRIIVNDVYNAHLEMIKMIEEYEHCKQKSDELLDKIANLKKEAPNLCKRIS